MEMTWALSSGAGPGAVMEWEATGGAVLTGAPVLALCLYDRRAFPPEVLRKALHTHPRVMIDGQPCRNFYYEPPDLLQQHNGENQKRMVDWMLAQLHGAKAAEGQYAQLARHHTSRAEAWSTKRRLSEILESITDAFFALDSLWRFTYVNAKAEELVGRSRQELLGKNVWELFPEAKGTRFFQECHRSMAEQTSIHMEEYYALRDAWFEIHAYPSKEGLSVYFQNITQRKKMESALRQSEEKYRSLVEICPDVVYSLNPDGTIASLSTAFERFTGWPLGEWLGRPFKALVHPEDLPLAMQMFQRVMSGETPPPYELRIRGSSGEYLVGEFRSAPRWANGKVVAKVGVVRDVTQRKELEQGLLLYKQTIANSSEAIAILDLQGRYLEQNQAHSALIGYSNEELQGKTPAVHLGEEAFAAIAQTLGKEGHFHGEVVSRSKDGTCRYIELSAFAVHKASGAPVCYVGIKRDVTERKRMETALRLLAQARTLLESSLDYPTTLDRIARLAVPSLADWCTVHLVDRSRRLYGLVVAHQDPQKEAWGRGIWERYPTNPWGAQGVARVVRTGEPVLYPEITDEMVQLSSQDEEHLRLLRQVGFRSAMVVPLKARGHVLGAMTFISAESGRRYTQEDLALAQELATACAFAVDNARLHQVLRQREVEFKTLVENSPDIIARFDRNLRFIYMNPAVETAMGRPVEAFIGKTHYELGVSEEVAQRWHQSLRQVFETGQESIIEYQVQTPEGPRIFQARRVPEFAPDGSVQSVLSVSRDITDRVLAEEAAKASGRKQAVVAELGQMALAGAELPRLMDEAVRRVAETLGVEFCKVLELLPDGTTFLLKAGVGWKEGLVGKATLEATPGSLLEYALLSGGGPVVMEDLVKERRFSIPALFLEHGIVSGISGVMIHGLDRPYGVMGAHTSKKRRFTQDDVHFLQAVANVVATAVGRKQAERRLAVQYAVSHVLAAAATLEGAAPGLLRTIGENLEWDVGALWFVDQGSHYLQCIATWQVPSVKATSFRLLTKRSRFRKSVGLPGMVWDKGEPVWFSDIATESWRFPRLKAAAKAGLRAAFIFPIVGARGTLGALELFSRRVQTPDQDLLTTAASLGRQIGQFIERKQAEEQVRYQARLLDMVEQAVIATDMEGRVLYWNAFAEKLYGWKAKEVLGKPAAVLGVSSPSRAQAEEIRSRLLKGESWAGESIVSRRDGTTFLATVTNSPVYDEAGRLIGIVQVSFDITEHKRIEEALSDSEQRYRSLFETATDVIFVVTKEGTILDVNPAVLEVLGYSREEMIGTNIVRLYVDPKDRARLTQEVEEKGVVRQIEVKFKRKDGTTIDCLISSTVKRASDGSVIGYQGIVPDITERKRAQERENKARLQFLNALAHEVRNPLTPMLSSAGMLKELLGTDQETVQGKLLNNMISGAEILKARVDDFLDVVAFQAGTFKLDMSVLDPRQALEEICDFMRPEATRKQQPLLLELPRKLPTIMADRRRFRQVVENLLLNAMKFSPEGRPITVRAKSQGKWVVFEVEDRGEGISAEEQKRLFQPYFRTEHDRQRFHGLGIGLALSKQIVEAHGGRIWVKSQVGQGSVLVQYI